VIVIIHSLQIIWSYLICWGNERVTVA